MKNAWKTALVISVLCLCGCALQTNAKYAKIAKEQEFDDFFPKPSFVRSFDTIEEAYDYIKTAQIKFSKIAGKPRAKGLSAKLIGPPVSGEQPVTVVCYLIASTANASINLSDPSRFMDEMIRKAVSAMQVFMVFYEDRGISLPNYYLKSGYEYTSGNVQPQQFKFKDITYNTDYPVGWDTEKAFSYLRKEID